LFVNVIGIGVFVMSLMGVRWRGCGGRSPPGVRLRLSVVRNANFF